MAGAWGNTSGPEVHVTYKDVGLICPGLLEMSPVGLIACLGRARIKKLRQGSIIIPILELEKMKHKGVKQLLSVTQIKTGIKRRPPGSLSSGLFADPCCLQLKLALELPFPHGILAVLLPASTAKCRGSLEIEE